MNIKAYRQFIETTLAATNEKFRENGLKQISLFAFSDYDLCCFVLSSLTDRQREATLLRFETEDPKPYSDIAREMGVTRGRAVQLVYAGYEAILKKWRLDHPVEDPSLETRITELHLSQRVYNGLNRNHTLTVSQVVDLMNEDPVGLSGLRAIRNIGDESVKEVIKSLNDQGIDFDPETRKWRHF